MILRCQMVMLEISMEVSPSAAVSAEPNWNSISKSISVISGSVVSKVKVCSSVVRSIL